MRFGAILILKQMCTYKISCVGFGEAGLMFLFPLQIKPVQQYVGHATQLYPPVPGQGTHQLLPGVYSHLPTQSPHPASA